MRGVHVDQHQAVAVLREHVDAVQLREREAERMIVVVGQIGTVGAFSRARRTSAHRTPRARSCPAACADCCASGRTFAASSGGVRAAATPSFSAADTAGCSAAVAASALCTARRTNWCTRAAVAKAHLGLGRMHVDVDQRADRCRATARTPAGGRGAARRDRLRAARARARDRARSGR